MGAKNTFTCAYCGEYFEVYRDDAKYCCANCRNKARGGKWQDKEWLREKYVEEDLPIKEIMEIAGCSKTTLFDWIDKHGLEKRGEGYRITEPEKYHDEDWLREKYHGERLSTSEIGEICDCSKQTIKLWLEKHGIEKRDRSEAAKVRMENNPELADKLIQAGTEALQEYGSCPQEEMTDEEFEAFCERLSKERTGEGNPMYGVTGPDNPQWKENTAPHLLYQTKKWKETRKEVLERDNHECQACGIEENLHIHHIRPVAEGGARFELNNLVTLCDTHHREWEGLYLRPDTR